MVNSTGMSGAVLLVGWGVVEKDAMELEIESASCGSWAVSAGRIEVPVHDVRTPCFVGVDKASDGGAAGTDLFAQKLEVW